MKKSMKENNEIYLLRSNKTFSLYMECSAGTGINHLRNARPRKQIIG